MVFKEIRQYLCIAICCIVFQEGTFKNMNNIGAMSHKFLRLSLYVFTEEHDLHELAQFLGDAAGLTDKFIRNWMHYVIDGISYDKNVSVFIKIYHYRSPPSETASALAASAANVF